MIADTERDQLAAMARRQVAALSMHGGGQGLERPSTVEPILMLEQAARTGQLVWSHHETAQAALAYGDDQESAEEWETVALYDLATGDRLSWRRTYVVSVDRAGRLDAAADEARAQQLRSLADEVSALAGRAGSVGAPDLAASLRSLADAINRDAEDA